MAEQLAEKWRKKAEQKIIEPKSEAAGPKHRSAQPSQFLQPEVENISQNSQASAQSSSQNLTPEEQEILSRLLQKKAGLNEHQ